MSKLVLEYLFQIVLHTYEIWFFLLLVGIPANMLQKAIKGKENFL